MKSVLSRRSSILVLIAGGVLVVVAFGALRTGGTARPPTDPSSPSLTGLVVAAEHLDFGETWENTRFPWVLPIENRQGHDIKIRDFAVSCSCLDIEPRSLVIPAGQTREVRLTLDLTDTTERKLPPPSLREFTVSISPLISGDGQTAPATGLKLRGRVRTAIYFDKPVVDFGRQSEAAQPLAPQKVVVTSFRPLEGLTAASKSDAFRVRVDRVSDDPSRFELTILPSKLSIGPIKSETTVVPVPRAGQPLPGMRLPVTGTVVPDFQASPPALLLGARQIGDTVEETVTVQSLAGHPFDVTGITVDGEGLVVEEVPSGVRAFLVKQRILKAGQQSTRALFRVRTRAEQAAEVSVSVSYLGGSTPIP